MNDIIPKGIQEFTEEKVKELMSLEGIESEMFDFKKEFPKDLRDAICAMANTFGGFIVIGIGENKKEKHQPFVVYGIDDVRLAEQKAKEIIIQVDPYPKCQFKSDVKVDGKEIFIINVEESKNKPHVLKNQGKILVRIGSHNTPASREVILRLFSDTLQIRKNLTILKSVLENTRGCAILNLQYLETKKGYPSEIETYFLKMILMNIGEFLIEKQLIDDLRAILNLTNSMNGKIRNIQRFLSNGVGPTSAYSCSGYHSEATYICSGCDNLIKKIDFLIKDID